MDIDPIDLTRLRRARLWRRDQGSAVFATDAAWDWFKRMHRIRLISEGALIVRRGRAGDLVHVERIAATVAAILAEQSAALAFGGAPACTERPDRALITCGRLAEAMATAADCPVPLTPRSQSKSWST